MIIQILALIIPFSFSSYEIVVGKKLQNWVYKRYSRSTFFENTISNLPKVLRAKFLGSDGLFCVSILKFGSFKNPSSKITILCELYFRPRRLLLFIQLKKVISMDYDSSTSSWKPWRWVRLNLILTMRDIYINPNLNLLTKLTNNSRSTEFKDIFPWQHTIPVSMRVVRNYFTKQDIPM